MSVVRLEQRPHLIDNGPLGRFDDDATIDKFYSQFDSSIRHCVTAVVYWEQIRTFGDDHKGNYRRGRLREFLAAVASDISPFDRNDADAARAIYLDLQERLGNDKKRRGKLAHLQGDIMIAAHAANHGFPVFTDDREDWLLLQSVVRKIRVGRGDIVLILSDEL